jgi:hypothetical protein
MRSSKIRDCLSGWIRISAMPAAGVEWEFVTSLIRQRVPADLFALARAMSFYLLDSEFELLRAQMSSDGEVTILTGLLSEKNLQIAVSDRLVCEPIGRLGTWPNALLCLAICYGRALFAGQGPDVEDLKIFKRNSIEVLWDYSEMMVWIQKRLRNSRIERHWILREGGAIRPREILGPHFATARSISVYDRFFRRATLQTLMDALECASQQRGGDVNCNVRIFHGEPGARGDVGFVDYATVGADLKKLVGLGTVVVEKIARGPAKRS